jgi:hypothetical protein
LRVRTVSTLRNTDENFRKRGKSETYLSATRCTNGLALPGLGVALAIASILSEIVAVNRDVCRSAGRTLKRMANSEAKVGVRRRSASSRTYGIFSKCSPHIADAYQKLDSREIPVAASAMKVIHNPSGSCHNDMGAVLQLLRLSHHIHSTDYDRCSNIKWPAEYCKLIGDLERQLSF